MASVHDLTDAMERLKLLPGGKSNPLFKKIDQLSCGTARGFRAADGRFDHDGFGPLWVIFEEREDNVYWRPRTGEIATLNGKAFALDEAFIDNASTYAFDGFLHISATVEGWLQSRYQSIYVLDWTRAFDKLRHASRIAVDEEIRGIYLHHMRPARMPKLFVRRANVQDHA